MKTNQFASIQKLAKEASISTSDLSKIIGGDQFASAAQFRCECMEGANPPYVTSWIKYYGRTEEIYSDISKICRFGAGKCTRIGG